MFRLLPFVLIGVLIISCQNLLAEDVKSLGTVYISVGGDNKLAWFNLDEKGKLQKGGEIMTDSGPGPIVINHKQKILYLGIRGAKSISAYKLSNKGTPEFLGGNPIFGNPVYLALDPSKKWLLTSHYVEGKSCVYKLDANGIPTGSPNQVIDAIKHPHSIQIDKSNKMAYVPNTGADKIFARNWDGSKGLISTDVTNDVDTKKGSGPRHFCFHPILPEVYFINEKDSTVSVFERDEISGKLNHLQTLSTLPQNYQGPNTCADIHVTPNGKFVYASNRGHNSIAAYRVDAGSGKLEAIEQKVTEKIPRAFNIDPTGKFLVVAGQDSGRIAVFMIDNQTGKLTGTDSVEVGKGPAWVEIVARP
ncbi:MAG: lactonase family protein [Planctomycetes bacterium]|nr:lactonase family protein [Planctomycetota bacterium]